MTTIVYVGNSDSQDISVFRLASDGALTLVETTPVPGPAPPGGSLPLAISPDKKRLYAGLRNEPYSAVSFTIDPATGKLSVIGSGPRRYHGLRLRRSYRQIPAQRLLRREQGQREPDRRRRHRRAADSRSCRPSPRPTPSSSIRPTATPSSPASAVMSCCNTASMPQAGTLTPNDPPARPIEPKGGPRHFVFSPDTRFVYLLNELDGTVHVLLGPRHRHARRRGPVHHRPARWLRRQALGRRHPHHARRQIPLRLRAHQQHPRRL